MRRAQKGFTVIETLLVLILLAILGFTGYYVYQTKSNTNSTYNSAAKSSQTPASSTNKFVFKELGVQIPLPDTLKGLTYNVDSQSPSLYDVTSPMFKPTDAICTQFAQIYKVNGKYNAQANASFGKSETLLKQFNGFYVAENVPICALQSDSGRSSVTALEVAFKSASLVQ